MIRNPRISFVTRKWPPSMGGMETYSVKLVEHLREFSEVEPIFLVGNQDGSTPGALRILLFGARAAALLIFVRKPADIVHIGDMASWPLALVAQLRSRKTTIAISAHGTDVSYPDKGGILGRLYEMYLRAGSNLLNAIVFANSPATGKRAQCYGFAKLVTVPLGTDIKPQENPEVGRNILFAGRLIPSKGCAWFIKNVLPALPSDVGLDVAGTIWDENERNALDAPKVRYMGKLERDELVSAYANALCVVVPNIESAMPAFEGFGLVAVEAAAAGGIVVASATSGVEAAVIDGKTGFKCPPEDADAWRQSIKKIAMWSPERRANHIATSIAETQSSFCWQRVAHDTFTGYGWPKHVQT